MALHPSLHIAFDAFDPDSEDSRESLLALGNGTLNVRGCAPWAYADGTHYPGTYHAGSYARIESVIEGERVETESIANLPNWLALDLLFEGESEPFSLDAFEILSYRHALEPATHTTSRDVVARDDLGRETKIAERRLVSIARPEIAAFRLEVEARDWSGGLEIRSGIDGRVINDRVGRYRPSSRRRFDVFARERVDAHTLLLTARLHGTRSGVAVAVRTRISGADTAARDVVETPASIAGVHVCRLARNEALVVEKIAAIAIRDTPEDAAQAALAALGEAGSYESLEEEHARVWRDLGEEVRLESEDEELADAAGYHAFQLLQTASPSAGALDAGFPARGWQEAYHAHVFWDELFVFPFLDLRLPQVTRRLLDYRIARLDAAREEARVHQCRGAMFPWRSAGSGREVTPALQLNPLSGRFMRDHTRLQLHIGAAVAHNAWHHWLATGDDAFLDEHGAELVVEIARFYASAAHHDAADDRYDFRGVVGPDEYHNAYPGAERPGIDTNAYTNVMAAWTLRRALDVLDRLPDARRKRLREALGLGEDEIALFDRVSRRMRLAFHGEGLLAQFAGFEAFRPIDPAKAQSRHSGKRLDWLLEARGETADAYQIVKQPDTMMLVYLFGEEELYGIVRSLGYALDEDALRRTIDHDLARTAHASSLSAAVCAGALARFDEETSWRFFRETLRPSDDPEEHSSAAEGLHLGTMAGMLDVLQRHYLGLRLEPDALHLRPAVPRALRPVKTRFRYGRGSFEIGWDGRAIGLRADPANAAPVRVVHRGGEEILAAGSIVTVAGR